MSELEVQDCDHDHRLQIIVPFKPGFAARLSFLLDIQIFSISCLLVDRIARIIQGPLAEVLLIALLHLDDETAPVLTFASDVKNHFAVFLAHPVVLRRNKVHILNLDIPQDNVQETDQHVLVRLRSEQSFEHEITQKFCILLSARQLLFVLIILFHNHEYFS